LAGAMSSAQLGRMLAPMIRKGYIHAISTTGANLEEDAYRLLANSHYKPIENYRMSAEKEEELSNAGFSRVTDLGIPEEEAMRVLEKELIREWQAAEKQGQAYFPHEYLIRILQSGRVKFDGAPENSWLLAAAEKNIHIVTPGWEDSTCGNMFVAAIKRKDIERPHIVKDGKEAMLEFSDWYEAESEKQPIGLFQIGGGIAGDFPICVVPMLRQDLGKDTARWSYFAQIRDSQESFGGYSGAYPTEKITWDKLSAKSKIFDIVSDATIVAPLIFSYVLRR